MHGKMQYINIQGIRSPTVTSNELQQLQKLVVFFFHYPKSGSCQSQHTVYFFVKLQAFIFSFSSKRNILDRRNGSISESEHWLLVQRSWSWCPAPIQWLTTIENSSSRGSNALWWPLWAPGIQKVNIHACRANTQHIRSKYILERKYQKKSTKETLHDLFGEMSECLWSHDLYTEASVKQNKGFVFFFFA